MPDPWAVVSSKPSGPPPGSDPWAVVSHKPAANYSEDDFDDKGSSYFPGEERKKDPATGRTLRHGMPGSFEGHPENIGEYPVATAGRAAEGAVDISRGHFAMGTHKLIQAGGNAIAPMAPILAAGAPLTALRALGGGAVGSKVAGTVAHASGASEDQKSLAEDAGNLVGGGAAATGLTRALLESPVKAIVRRTPILDILEQGPRKFAFNKLKTSLSEAPEATAAGPVPSDNEPAPAPYRMRGNQIHDAVTVTPRPIVRPKALLTEGTPDVPAPAEASPAPYRMRGAQIQDATTVTPRPAFTPKGLLGEGTASGPIESEPETTITLLRATSPKAAQTEILRKAGVASPAATIKPMTRVPNADITPRADLKFSGSHSGEEAAMNQLTENVTPDRLGINELRGIAQQRGIKVSPGDNHVALYRKIQDSLTPEEIEQFDQARIERMQPDYSLPPISRAAEQGGHAGNGVSSVEELGRPGTNYVVSKSGQLTYHGKSFAPEGIPAGSTHVTALPDGTLRVNAGPQLTEAQEVALRKAIPESGPRVPVSDTDRENLLMRSIQRAKSAKAGD